MNKHRGKHEEDDFLFSHKQLEKLKEAAKDLNWLLNRGYSLNASLKLVGDRFQLRDRQRIVLARVITSTQIAKERFSRCVKLADIKNNKLSIDSFNVLITIESAIAGGYIFECLDGAIRDIASVHGSWRKVVETEQAINYICLTLKNNSILKTEWIIDLPVSNSKRLASIIREGTDYYKIQSDIVLIYDSDRYLKQECEIVATSDSSIIDKVQLWVNIAKEVIENYLPNVEIIRIL